MEIHSAQGGTDFMECARVDEVKLFVYKIILK